jgi:hypothetical protein
VRAIAFDKKAGRSLVGAFALSLDKIFVRAAGKTILDFLPSTEKSRV